MVVAGIFVGVVFFFVGMFEDDFGAAFSALLLCTFFGFLLGGVAEEIEGPEVIEYEEVQSLECLHTTDGIQVFVNDERLFSESQYEVALEGNRVRVEEYHRDAWTWPFRLVDRTQHRLEFSGCLE
jgi:hypothetical protein